MDLLNRIGAKDTGLSPRSLLLACSLLGISCTVLSSQAGERSAEDQKRSCTPPASLTGLSPIDEVVVRSLAGDYVITVVSHSGAARRSIDGKLALASASPLAEQGSNVEVTFPLNGWSDIDFTAFGTVGLVYSPSSRDPKAPGVRGVYDRSRHDLVFQFGGLARDRGVLFWVDEVEKAALKGHWQDGSLRVDAPHGNFCAWRVGPRRA
jgi:hypothetical protein